MNIKPILNLNSHPSVCENTSFVNANNVKLSNDGACITNEESLKYFEDINDQLSDLYEEFDILGFIPCNEEVVLFIKIGTSEDMLLISVIRYDEKSKVLYSCLEDLLLYEGAINGTFTYNASNELIIAFCEYPDDEDNWASLKSINLGIFGEETVIANIDNYANVPNVELPIVEHEFIDGTANSGWYKFYIRYKLNSLEYTDWVSIGVPVFLATLKEEVIYDYKHMSSMPIVDPVSATILTAQYITNQYDSTRMIMPISSDVSNKNIKITLLDLDENFSEYQLGFACTRKDFDQSYVSNNLLISQNEYALDFSNTYSDTNFLVENIKLYNVKNIINNNNSIYVANFKERVLKLNSSFDTSFITLGVELDDYQIGYKLHGYHAARYIKSSNDAGVEDQSRTLEFGIFECSVDAWNAGFVFENNFRFYNPDLDWFQENIRYPLYASSDKKSKYFVPYDNLDDSSEIMSILAIDSTSYSPYWLGEIHIQDPCYNSCGNYSNPLFNLDDPFPTTLLPNTIYDFYYHNYNYENSNGIRILPPTLEYDIFIYRGVCYEIEKYTKFSQCGNLTISSINYFNDPDYIEKSISGSVISSIGDPDDYVVNLPQMGYLSGSPGFLIKRNKKGFEYHYLPHFKTNNGTFNIYNLKITNNNTDCSNFSISYAIIEPTEIYTGITTNHLFYNDLLNIEDSITTNFNKSYVLNDCSTLKSDSTNRVHYSYYYSSVFTDLLSYSQYNNKSFFQYECSSYASPTLIDSYYVNLNIAGSTENSGVNTNIDIDYPSSSYYQIDLINYNNSFYEEVSTLYPLVTIKYSQLDENNSIVVKGMGFPSLEFAMFPNPELINAATNKFNASPSPHCVFFRGVYSTIPKRAIHINNYNSIQSFPMFETHTTYSSSETAKVVESSGMLDLFKNKHYSREDIIINTLDYYEDDIRVEEFNKTIRKSNVIQDESLVNSWKIFDAEDYKQISENKGSITNIVSIGSIFLMHTEYSLFMIDTSNILKTLDTDIQLSQGAIFDLDYKEVFTSNLGYGGLKNRKSAILANKYGYFFYDSSTYRFYQFDNNQLLEIDDSIRLWLDYTKPYAAKFANDIKNDRLIITLNILKDDLDYEITISYSLKTKSFVSFHDYGFEDMFNTKNELYLQSKTDSLIYKFNEGSYGKLDDNILISQNNGTHVSIVINEDYTSLKLLEYIKYKLRKVKFTETISTPPLEDNIANNTSIYSGDNLRIFNNKCDTKEIDISVTELNKFGVYDKPVYDLGGWAFNYIRNNLSTTSETYNRMIHGNYFILQFKFNNEDNTLFELEELTVKYVKNK